MNKENLGNQPVKRTNWKNNEQLKLTVASEEDQDVGSGNPNTNKEERKRQKTDSTQGGEEEHIPDTLEKQIEKFMDEEESKFMEKATT